MEVSLVDGFDEILGDIEVDYEKDIFLRKVFGSILNGIRVGSENPFDLRRVCSFLCVSERTLYRRLKKRGKTYLEIKDEVRARYAFYLLSSKKYTVEQISEFLFFKNSGAFIQYFKRLHGLPPKKWSRQINENVDQEVDLVLTFMRSQIKSGANKMALMG